MKKQIRTVLLLSAGALAFTSCGGAIAGSSSSFYSSSSSTSLSPSSSASSSSSVNAVTLEEAFANTTTYALKGGMDQSYIIEYIANNIYYNAFNAGGLITLESDKAYAHEFSTTMVDLGDDGIHFQMDVHGIVNYASIIASYNTNHGFKYTLSSYIDDFVKDQNDPFLYSCSVTALATTCKNYFQSLALAYCNYFEIRLNSAGKLASFTAYERSDDLQSKGAVTSVIFADETLADFEPYSLWVKAGSLINMRIIDWKSLTTDKLGRLTFFYEGKEATITGTVTAIDASGDVYVAADNTTTGPVGIRAHLSKDEKTALKIYDVVTLKGVIASLSYEAYLNEATVSDVSSTPAVALPCFDEEPIAVSYGDGAYAAALFSQAPNYIASLYSFECYVKDLTLDVTDKTYSTCTLVFPAYQSGTAMLNIQLRIEKSLTHYSDYIATLSAAKSYGETDQSKMAISNGLVEFFPNIAFSYIAINLTDTSSLAPAMSALQKAQAILGDPSFSLPTLESDATANCYHIGPGKSESLEAVYGLGEGTTNVLKYSATVTATAYQDYLNALTGESYVLFDKIRDPYGVAHALYKKGESIVDMTYVDSGMGGSTLTLYLYSATTFIRSESFFSAFGKKVPSAFSMDDYVKVSGSYEADYSYFELTNYAGNTYTDKKFLVSTISLHGADTTSDTATFNALVTSYTNEGYAAAQNASGASLNYRTRGVSHRLLEKNGVIVDLSLYPTSDYTFTGSDEFTDRIEVAIYLKSDYRAPTFVKDGDVLNAQITKEYGADFTLALTMPSGCYYESYCSSNEGKLIDYGYGYSSDFFFYPSSDVMPGDLLTALRNSITASGYTLQYTTDTGYYLYAKSVEGKGSNYLFVMPNKNKGYVRLILGTGGTRFY